MGQCLLEISWVQKQDLYNDSTAIMNEGHFTRPYSEMKNCKTVAAGGGNQSFGMSPQKVIQSQVVSPE